MGMKIKHQRGWPQLIEGYPWFQGKGMFPLPAYSEFMPPPRLGCNIYTGEIDRYLFSEDDPFGWTISEVEEEYYLRPGLENAGRQIMEYLIRFGGGLETHPIRGHLGQNLKDNPYCPPELIVQAGHLDHERFVVLLPLSLSKTQDDKGRVRWTLFGSSEQGPEKAFWKSFYLSPGKELPEQSFYHFISRILIDAYGFEVKDSKDLRSAGFRILPSIPSPQYSFWKTEYLPSWTSGFIANEEDTSDDIKFLLTFRPFATLPSVIKEKYFAGKLVLLPSPFSLLFWGVSMNNHTLEGFQIQTPLLSLVRRHDGPGGIRVPQSGWFHEPKRKGELCHVVEELLLNTYHRTSRWDKVNRNEDAVAASLHIDRITETLFSTELGSMDLYNKPMARNCQIWNENGELLIDGPFAERIQIKRASEEVLRGGVFRYRFMFPAMQVGNYEVYWQRPLAGFIDRASGQPKIVTDELNGYLTAYPLNSRDLSDAIELWPRFMRREIYLNSLHNFGKVQDHYSNRIPMNILYLLNSWEIWGRHALPRSFAGKLISIPKKDSIEKWINSIGEYSLNAEIEGKIRMEIQSIIEQVETDPGISEPFTYGTTATRTYEEAYWRDILILSKGKFINKDNADVVKDTETLKMAKHSQRDLDPLGEYLISRHTESVKAAGMEGKAIVGEIPFKWKTDFDFSFFGGWDANQDDKLHERDILVMIPGKNRKEAVVLADHYDTAYMADVYDKSAGGSGARLSAAGADDNDSATATLLLAAPVYLQMSKEGLLERDIWLLHLTGEEFPSDCLGARYFCQALIEKTLKLITKNGNSVDLSAATVKGVFVMDMIAHNRDDSQDVFQISPGKSSGSLQLAYQAHLANQSWNLLTSRWNGNIGRRDKARGKRSADGMTIPETALHPKLDGQVRLPENPYSTLYNTDGQIFSDCGVPVVLFMEDYDINRTGYHDTHDTMENIDLDYGAALSAIAIETVARVATIK